MEPSITPTHGDRPLSQLADWGEAEDWSDWSETIDKADPPAGASIRGSIETDTPLH